MRTTALVLAALAAALPLRAADDGDGHPTITIARAPSGIVVDGDLSDPAWKSATRVDKWWETNPGDNTEPKVKSVGYLMYDDKYFYAGFDFQDPDPSKIASPYNDRDHIGGNTDDYGGVILDTRHDHKTAILFLATARGIQYDAVSDDSTGNEDSSPDFFWDSAAKINDHGWTLEIRIPLSSLRYDGRDPQEWGIMLYRNWPRDRRYQMFANKLPRGGNCFICNENTLAGLSGLPPAGHMIVAPYATAKQVGEPRDGLGTQFVNRPVGSNGGADLKWTPTPDSAVDATLNPDFSQIESDVAVITANERFAIFLPEKRPFFLEGVELFSTPIQAVYTRTITSPRWGTRLTGKSGANAYTFLVAQDRGGGSVILPSAVGSDTAIQEFKSTDFIGRVRHDFSRNSFVSALLTDRELGGGAHNRVFGPDFQLKNRTDTLTGQFLVSDSATPDRPDLAAEWNGQRLRGHAYDVWWSHSTEKFDWYSQHQNYTDNFRADAGFVPQVGYGTTYSETGWTFFPKGFYSRLRTFAMAQYDTKEDGSLLYRLLSFGYGADGRYRSFTRFRYAYDTVRNGDTLFQRHQLLWSVQFSVNRVISQLETDGWIGQQVDFTNNRLGRGANVNTSALFRPTDHLELSLTNGLRWLRVNPGDGRDEGRLFTAQFERVRTTYTFNQKMFVRTIVQNQRTNQNQRLYAPTTVDQHDGSLAGQILYAYKV
ncbi:MAG TPA: DUF5916 domain-containing protein, partial [Thermoanaerobaculia bacterium]|nr:DUF5916 domain-containing protein [Thermoanaerobaculia bacterium]